MDAGVADASRIAVGGHSYGAFMAANLLAHAGHLFAAGVARSGAYNRCGRLLGVSRTAANSQDVSPVLRLLQQRAEQSACQCVEICALQRGCKIVEKLFCIVTAASLCHNMLLLFCPGHSRHLASKRRSVPCGRLLTHTR